MNQYKLYKAS